MSENIAHIRFKYLPITESFIYEQIKNLKSYTPHIFCMKKENLDEYGLENIHCLNDENILKYIYNGLSTKITKYTPYFSSLIEKYDIRLLHAQFGREGAYSIKLKERHDIPHVTSFRGWGATKLPQQKPRIYKKLFKRGDLFLVRCQDMKKDLIQLGAPEEKIEIHHSAQDLSNFDFKPQKLRENTVRILFVGSLSERKGVVEALKAIRDLINEGKNIEFRIGGDGKLNKKISKLINKYNLRNKVKMLGYLSRDEVAEEMKKAHIFLAPSKEVNKVKEGIPNVLMEALVSGLPVISTKHGGIPELIHHKENGLLAEEGNIEDLKEKIKFMIENPSLWRKYTRNGKKIVEKEFNIQKQTKKLENRYKKLISKYS